MGRTGRERDEGELVEDGISVSKERYVSIENLQCARPGLGKERGRYDAALA
jgi:hypothetical protein